MDTTEFNAREAWNAGAEAFIHFVETGADYYRHLVHGPGLLAACGNVRGLNTLDLGCGHGYFSRLLARGGAKVTGVDLADKLIAQAAEMEGKAPLGISYLQMDAATITDHFQKTCFDLVTGCMSLQDMADPAAVLWATNHLLKPDGRAVFSVPHPCTDPPFRQWKRDEQGHKLALCLDRYFEAGPAVCEWNMPRLQSHWRTPFHRFTLTQWSEMIASAGFVIRRLHEPRPSVEAIATHPDLNDCSRMPYFLVFEMGKVSRHP